MDGDCDDGARDRGRSVVLQESAKWFLNRGVRGRGLNQNNDGLSNLVCLLHGEVSTSSFNLSEMDTNKILKERVDR